MWTPLVFFKEIVILNYSEMSTVLICLGSARTPQKGMRVNDLFPLCTTVYVIWDNFIFPCWFPIGNSARFDNLKVNSMNNNNLLAEL